MSSTCKCEQETGCVTVRYIRYNVIDVEDIIKCYIYTVATQSHGNMKEVISHYVRVSALICDWETPKV